MIYNPNGTVRSDNALGGTDNTIAGRDVYTVDKASSATFTGVNQDGGVALVVDGSVVQFLSFNGALTATEEPANGMTSTALGRVTQGDSWETPDNGATYDMQSTPTPGTVPFYTAGTHILTHTGYRPVENLRPGDLIWTEDDGYQPILWVGRRILADAQCGDPTLLPVRIPANAIAPGVPMRDLNVSPNHRLALSHAFCALYFQSDTALAPAKAMLGHRGITAAPAHLPVRYYHLLLARHSILRAEGAAAESFQPEAMGLTSLDSAARAEVLSALHAHDGSDRQSARIVATPGETRLLLDCVGAAPIDMPATSFEARAA